MTILQEVINKYIYFKNYKDNLIFTKILLYKKE